MNRPLGTKHCCSTILLHQGPVAGSGLSLRFLRLRPLPATGPRSYIFAILSSQFCQVTSGQYSWYSEHYTKENNLPCPVESISGSEALTYFKFNLPVRKLPTKRLSDMPLSGAYNKDYFCIVQ